MGSWSASLTKTPGDDTDTEKMWLKRQVPKQCARSYLAVDQSKFGKQSMTWINQLEDYTGVITDRQFTPEEIEVLEVRGVRIIGI